MRLILAGLCIVAAAASWSGEARGANVKVIESFSTGWKGVRGCGNKDRVEGAAKNAHVKWLARMKRRFGGAAPQGAGFARGKPEINTKNTGLFGKDKCKGAVRIRTWASFPAGTRPERIIIYRGLNVRWSGVESCGEKRRKDREAAAAFKGWLKSTKKSLARYRFLNAGYTRDDRRADTRVEGYMGKRKCKGSAKVSAWAKFA